MAPLIVVTGTGTEIGKTFFSESLVRAWAEKEPTLGVLGFKPIESGGDEDGRRLEQVSTFHVTRFTAPYLLMDAVSPHLAARREGRSIEIDRVRELVTEIRTQVGALVVELPGGLFTPLSPKTTNVDLVRALAPQKTCLVAPNRLGVLHDVIATREAARAHHVTIDAIILSDAERADASSASNHAELENTLTPPVPRIVRLLRDAKHPANETSVRDLLAGFQA